MTPSAVKALQNYIARADAAGEARKVTIFKAVVLTKAQRTEVELLLTGFWKKPMGCPLLLDIKPQHGYRSRVLKDGFTGQNTPSGSLRVVRTSRRSQTILWGAPT